MSDPENQRIRSLIAEADSLVVSDPRLAMATAQQAIALAHDAGDQQGYGQALCSYAATLFFQAKYSEARQAFREAQHVGRAQSDRRLTARAVNGLGITSRALEEYGAAMEFFLSSLQLSQEAGDEVMRLRVLSNIGLIHSQLGDHALSLSVQLDVMSLAHTLKLPLVESAAGVNTVVAYHDLGDFRAALALIDERLPITQRQRNQLNEMLLRTYQALSLLALDQPQEAVAAATTALHQAQALGNEDSVAQLHTTLGDAYHRLGEDILARDHLEQALALGQQVGQLRESRALKVLSELEASQGRWQAAYAVSQRQQALERALQEQTTQRKVQVLSAQMQLEVLKREAAASRSRTAELEEHVAERTRELQRANELLRHAAFHDGLTGLGNRSLFHRHLRRAMHPGTQGAVPTYAVLFLDCDRFKQVNDTLGHDVGDQVLRAFAERLQANLPPATVLARFGGDEFAVLLESAQSPETALAVASRIRESLGTPIAIAGRSFLITAGIGVVMGNSSYLKAEEVLRDADIAMYHAKAMGTSEIALFTTSMYERTLHRTVVEGELRAALNQDLLSVHYQPIVDVQTGEIISLEALARWFHPELGTVPPDTFIPVAEDAGLIIELDRQILKKACLQVNLWNAQLRPDVPVHLNVNISAAHFAHATFSGAVIRLLDDTGFPPALLRFEITERLLLDRSPVAQANLDALHQLGIEFHIDDFGTGYSSLAYLQEFTASTLKIDRSFIRGINHTSRSAEMVRTILAMAKNLNMSVVAEGVYTQEQWAWLSREGCGQAQGHYFSPPVGEHAVTALLRQPQRKVRPA